MTGATDTDFLACPRCGSALRELSCTSCRQDFPTFDGVACLFAEPQSAAADWRNRWRLERQNLNRLEQIEADTPRLQRVRDGARQQRSSIEAVLAPMITNDVGGARETLLGLRTRLPSHHAPTSYNTQICRDWVWGQEETEPAYALFGGRKAFRGARVGVLGAGAGGLAHRVAADAEAVVAVDSNPLLCLIAARMNGGEPLAFVETPISPKTSEDASIVHQLKPGPRRDNLTHIWADAIRAPFHEGSFDIVITHWLVDVIDVDPADLSAQINALLRLGGRWFNQGSVAFNHDDPTRNLSPEELLAAVEEKGFAASSSYSAQLPYLCSPHSRHHRHEEVFGWHTTKQQAMDRPRLDHLPAWLSRSSDRIPLSESFRNQAATTRIHAAIMSLIDGQRSLDDIALELERNGLMPQAEAREAVRGMLTRMWEESRR